MANLLKKLLCIVIFTLYNSQAYPNTLNFEQWLKDFKVLARSEGISEKTINKTLVSVKFIPKVIEYDRYQP